jgi:hypothetical protein
MDLHIRVGSDPKLPEALLNVEEDEAEGWKKMHDMVVKERDETVRKNTTRYVEFQEANRKLTSMPAAAAPGVRVPASPSAIQPMSLCPMSLLLRAKTPGIARGRNPKGPLGSSQHWWS